MSKLELLDGISNLDEECDVLKINEVNFLSPTAHDKV